MSKHESTVGDVDGVDVGVSEGDTEWATVGYEVVGDDVGNEEGIAVGTPLCALVGDDVGKSEGEGDG